MRIRDQLIQANLWASTNEIDPEYDLAAAWQITEHLRDLGWMMILANRVSSRQHEDGAMLVRAEYRVDLSHPNIQIKRAGNAVSGYGPTAALAICRAILEALPYLDQVRGHVLTETTEIVDAPPVAAREA